LARGTDLVCHIGELALDGAVRFANIVDKGLDIEANLVK
jgi:hypothetical protein